VKRYLVLLAIVILVGIAAVVATRARRDAAGPARGADARPEVALAIAITPEGEIDPASAAVPKDHLVRLTVTNHYRRQITLTLMGYQDRFGVAYVDADSVWQGSFVADRPGDGFAWILEGAPVGRLEVTGVHMIEGHQ
jgi:hypothetical protein